MTDAKDLEGVSPFQPGPLFSPRFCLRCLATLPYRGEAKCPQCGWQFDAENPATYRSARYRIEGIRTGWKFWLPGYLLAVACGVISYGVCLQTGELGFALFVAVPVSFGAILGYATRIPIAILVLLGIITLGSVVATLVSMNFAGLFCGATLGLIFLIPTTFGLVLGWTMRALLKASNWNQRFFLPLIGFILLPYATQTIEWLLPNREEIATVRTELTVHATPQQAWDAIMFYEEVEHAPPMLLKFALPKPIRSVGDKQREGEVVRCIYDRGVLAKRISRVEPGRRLAFDVVEQHLHFERDLALLDGSFELESSGEQETRIVLTTRYQRKLAPRPVWEPIERKVIHTLHRHVLEGMRLKAERECRESSSPPPAEKSPPSRPLARGLDNVRSSS